MIKEMLFSSLNGAYRVDKEKKIILSYQSTKIDNSVAIYGESELKGVCLQEAQAIEKFFQISLADYGVEIMEEEEIEIPIDFQGYDEEFILGEKPSVKKEYDKALYRLITIIIKIQNNQLPTTKELAVEFNVSERTIQTDIYKRLSSLPILKDEQHRFYFDKNFSFLR